MKTQNELQEGCKYPTTKEYYFSERIIPLIVKRSCNKVLFSQIYSENKMADTTKPPLFVRPSQLSSLQNWIVELLRMTFVIIRWLVSCFVMCLP